MGKLSLQLYPDGHLGSFQHSSGNSNDVVSCVAQESETSIFLPSSSDTKLGNICWWFFFLCSDPISYLNVGNVKEQCWPYTSQLKFTCLLMVSLHHIVVLEGFFERISLAHYPEPEELEKATPKKSVYLKSLGPV